MTEKEFIRLCRDNLNLKSDSEAKERVELFWLAITETLKHEKKVVFKDWGVFEKKEVKPRKVVIPTIKDEFYTEPKKIIRFKCGKGLRARVNINE